MNIINKLIIVFSQLFGPISPEPFIFAPDTAYQNPEKTIVTEVEFKGHPIRMEIIPNLGKEKSYVNFYDDKDSVLGGERPAPFLHISVYHDKSYDNVEWWISEVAKTDALAGKDVVELAKSLQQLLAISNFKLIDAATSLQCPKDRTWCFDEAKIPLRIAGVFTKGGGFYESMGAKSVDDSFTTRKDYRKSADFLHHGLKVKALLDDLISLKEDHPKAQYLYQCLIDSFAHAGLEYTPELTFSDLANAIYKKKDANLESHLFWHTFANQVINNKDGFFFEIIKRIISNPSLYDKQLIEAVSGIAWLDIEVKEYIEDHPDDDQNIIQDVRDSTSGLDRNIFLKTSEESRRKFDEFSNLFEAYNWKAEKQIFEKNVEAALNKKIVRVFRNINLISSLIDDLEKNQYEKQYPPGHVYAVWMLAKYVVNEADMFAFDFTPSKD